MVASTSFRVDQPYGQARRPRPPSSAGLGSGRLCSAGHHCTWRLRRRPGIAPPAARGGQGMGQIHGEVIGLWLRPHPLSTVPLPLPLPPTRLPLP